MSGVCLVLALALLVVAMPTTTRAAVVVEEGYPIMWQKCPASLAEMPAAAVDGSTVTFDPWQYPQRMAMYRLLMSGTEPHMKSMGPSANDNPLWGLPLQLGWKLKSGRLVDPTEATTCGKESEDMCISPSSWWACVNYFLSVIPFLSAEHAGLIGQADTKIMVAAPSEGAEDYCTSYADCSTKHADLMAKWDSFFTTLKTASESDAPDADKRNQILSTMWAAQKASLEQAATTCAPRKAAYSSPETSFAQSWINSANYVSAAYFHSGLDKSVQFMSPLPSRVLTAQDNPPNISDLSAEENHTLYIFGWMNSINNLLGGTLVRMWQSAMCSDSAREKGRALLDDLVLNPKFAVSGLLSILTEMATSC
ncbi:liver-enriched gene 1, tandem duplicate 1 [Engraulis encrasicolus]|uniref:liver-enriched gene 1, tandem duplicate 1 n=1 Tax=Engraulis encrasicolus TaxID=184585 RepID=UPI002FD51F19